VFFHSGNIHLSKKMHRNTIRYDNVDYVLSPLSKEYDRSKGGNSNVFKISDPQSDELLIIKFSKYDVNSPTKPINNIKRIARFGREIEALKIATECSFQNVIKYYFNDYREIGKRKFHYYVMEKADYDLTKYLDTNDISEQQRFLLCIQILNGIKELHSKDIYHRDIKPDNILFVNKVWKIGDLGLVENRNSDFEIKEVGERIGPIGWLSPEAANKYLNEGEGKGNKFGFDCNIDAYSDIFQLGKLFWYIFQGNIPIGQIKKSDFKLKDKEIFDILHTMLNHSKTRPTLEEVETGFQSRYSSYGI
jgi:serine/threonine protein kinase